MLHRSPPQPFSSTTPFFGPRLVAFVDAATIRLGLQWGSDEPLTHVTAIPIDAHETLADALKAYLAKHPYVRPQQCAIGAVAEVCGDRVEMLMRPWSFSIDTLTRELSLRQLVVLRGADDGAMRGLQ
jgi:glucokinase